MTDREENKRLRRIVIVLSVAVFLLLSGFVAYLSYGLSKLNSIVSENSSTTSSHSITIKKLESRIEEVASQAKLPGPKGDKGDTVVGGNGKDGTNGKDSKSTVEKTTVVKQVPVDGKDGKNGQDGENARQTIFCRIPGTLEIGWAFVGTNNCMPVEVLQ